MPGRPATLNTETALELAMQLFWEYGYSETSISDLELALGAGRQSIYNRFGDKYRLFLKAYQHYLDTRLSAALELLQQGETPQAKLRNLFLNSLDCSSEKHLGCFIGNTLVTPIAHKTEIEAITDKAIQQFLDAIKTTIAPLYSNDQDLEDSSWNLFSLFQGAQLIAKQKNTRENLTKAIDRVIGRLG